PAPLSLAPLSLHDALPILPNSGAPPTPSRSARNLPPAPPPCAAAPRQFAPCPAVRQTPCTSQSIPRRRLWDKKSHAAVSRQIVPTTRSPWSFCLPRGRALSRWKRRTILRG